MGTGQVGRTIRYADEVWTPTGIVDSIRFEDYVSNRYEDCKLIHYDMYKEDATVKRFIKNGINIPGQCKMGEQVKFPNKSCKGCFLHINRVEDIDMCTTCFECKITLSDFKSENGHNFHGNRNYYVVPSELVEKIENLVPEEIGIIKYTGAGLRLYKECKFRPITDEMRWILLYNAMKKWCDGKQKMK